MLGKRFLTGEQSMALVLARSSLNRLECLNRLVMGQATSRCTNLLRLLYVDQMTPVQRLFRVENFDTWQTRQAVGDLLAGVGGYDLFDRQIELRDTQQAL